MNLNRLLISGNPRILLAQEIEEHPVEVNTQHPLIEMELPLKPDIDDSLIPFPSPRAFIYLSCAATCCYA